MGADNAICILHRRSLSGSIKAGPAKTRQKKKKEGREEVEPGEHFPSETNGRISTSTTSNLRGEANGEIIPEAGAWVYPRRVINAVLTAAELLQTHHLTFARACRRLETR